MIFVDTNYFLRFLLQDNNNQYQEAKNFFLKAAQGKLKLITSLVVFFEVCWVLRSVYGKDKASLINTLSKITSLNIDFEQYKLITDSLNLFRDSSLSLEDCYNLAFAKQKKVREFKTFDLKLAKQFNQTVIR